MKKLIISLAALMLFAVRPASAQVLFGQPTLSTSVTLTVAPTGGGTGTINSSDGKILNCSISGGTCTTSYNIGSSVVLTPTATGGSTFNWGTGTGSAVGCSGSAKCSFNIILNSNATAIFTAAGSGGTGIQKTLFGAVFNSATTTAGSPWPPVDGRPANASIAECRIWDTVAGSGGDKVGQILTVSGAVGSHTYAFNWTDMDATMNARCKHAAPPANAPMRVVYTVGDTPAGVALGTPTGCATPTAQSCAAYDDNTAGGVSETDKTMNTFIATLMTRYPTIDAIEIQNEWDSPNFQCWSGAACGGGPDPHTTVNAAMNKAMIRRGWDIMHIAKCINPSVHIYSPSMHVGTVLPGQIFDNMLNSTVSAPAGVAGVNGVPAGCSWAANSTVHGYDIFDTMNIHADGPSPNLPESLITTEQNVQKEYAARVTAGHPLPATKVCDECGYRNGETSTDDERAGNVARRYLLAAYLGYSGMDWYQWDTQASGTIALGGHQAGTAYDIIYGWIVGNTVGTFASPSGTVYTETLTKVTTPELIIWDSGATNANGGYTCNNTIGGSGCTTVTVGSGFTSFTDLTGASHSIVGHQVPASGKPICVSTGPC